MKVQYTDYEVGCEVERLFSADPARCGDVCRNPITGESYVRGYDRIGPQKMAAYRALVARKWFAIHGPADVQPLPLWCDETNIRCRPGLLPYIVWWYARSLSDGNYDVNKHPAFADYVSGVLWEDENVEGGGKLPGRPDEVAELKKRFPPRELAGMDTGFAWSPPKRNKRAKKGDLLNQARYDELKRKRERANSINTPRTRPPIEEYATVPEVIDPGVIIPESVRRAAAVADSIHRATVEAEKVSPAIGSKAQPEN